LTPSEILQNFNVLRGRFNLWTTKTENT
jgi:hypothetical protein